MIAALLCIYTVAVLNAPPLPPFAVPDVQACAIERRRRLPKYAELQR